MGFFSRDREDEPAPTAVAEAPHPALESLEAFRDASLADAAVAVLLLGYADARPGSDRPRSDLTLRAQSSSNPPPA